MTNKVSVLILAGQREGVTDQLCQNTGVKWKALLPIHGIPMIEYVFSALAQSSVVENPYWISGVDQDLVGGKHNQSPAAAGPASSVVVAAEAGIPYPFMVTTCDHPLLTPEMVDAFVGGAQMADVDFALGLAEKSIIQPAYPNVKRTYLKFANVNVSGCNLFYIKNEKGLEAIRFWQAAQNDRKKPAKLASRLGFGMLFKYVTGRLTLAGAFEYVSARFGIKAEPVILPFAEAAIDVDKPSDLELVTSILAKRQ